MDTKQLKQRILDLAIRGKLVPQDPNDEPASVLLGRIRAEKEQLIAQGKLKKSKTKASDKPHYENVPFEIPENWEWVIVEDVFAFHQGIQVDKDKQSLIPQKGYVRFLRIIDYTQSLEPPRYVKDPGKIYHVSPTDLVMIRYGSPGTPCMGYDGVIANNLFRIIPFVNNSIECKYAYHFFTTSYFQAQCRATGVAMSAISFSTINKIAFPLPPLAEQQRIVAEIEKWFALIDELEANKEDLKEYIKQVKSKVLDLAIHGKLVPQDPNDEPAIELLKRINPNFKPCDTSHYENLPKGWCICPLNQVTNIARGGSPRPIKDYITTDPNGINWIKIGDTEKNGKYINDTKEKIKPEGISRSRMIHKGDFLLTNSMSFGRPYISNIDGCIHDGWLVISPIANIYDKDFLYYLLSSSYAYNQFSEKASGTAVSNLNIEKVANALFPLPPLAEQKRITKNIDIIFDRLDTISAEL